MITAGIDSGVKTVKAVIVKDNGIIASGIAPANGFERAQAAEQLWLKVLEQAGLSVADVDMVIATGMGRTNVSFAKDFVVEAVADIKAAHFLFPSARTVIDAGAEQVRVIRFDKDGKMVNYVLNQQCGAELGTYLEAFARMLDATPEGISKLALGSKKNVSISGECAVFAGMDVVSLIHKNAAKADIAQAILDAVANKIAATANLTSIGKPVALIGGVACNTGVVEALKRRMDADFLIPEEPQMAGALGAALVAASVELV